MAMKPLKDLLEEADKFLGTTKQASVSSKSDEVSSLADTLIFANELEEQFALQKQAAPNAEYDVAAESVLKQINKIAARIEWEVLDNAEKFEEAALEAGYTEDQVTEALSKIAAAKVKKNLGVLAATGELLPGEDKNTIKKVLKKTVGEASRTTPVTHGKGGLK